MKKFDEIKIGDSATLSHMITEADVKKFVELTGDDNKLHVDDRFAARTTFKKPVAHGMLSASFISTIIGTQLPGDGALWFAQNLEFLLPVRIGDTLTVQGEVISKNERTNSIELSTQIHNQNKQLVTTGTAKVRLTECEPDNNTASTPDLAINNVLVLGASGGIGEAIARKLAEDGFNIILHYNSGKQRTEKLAEELTALNISTTSIQADLLAKDGVKMLISKSLRSFGSIDAVVNAATIALGYIKFENLDWEILENHLLINIKTNYEILKAVLPGMKERKKGKVIFITTQSTDGTPPPELAHYVTAKYALAGFAKSLAVEFGNHNVQINLVSPGMTETSLIADVSEKARLLSISKTPLRRLAQPQDVAAAVAFLLSPGGNYITGETIRVNGGISMV